MMPVRSAGATSTEWYGFVGWITTFVAYVLFLTWAYVSETWLTAAGITYYPSKYWAIGVLTWLAGAVIFVFWSYEALCMMSAPSVRSLNTLHDKHSKWAEDVGLEDPMCGCHDSIPPLVDIPITSVCRMLYANASAPVGKEADENEL